MELANEIEKDLNIDNPGHEDDPCDFTVDDNEDFYFESDHLALRGNADYRAVLRAIVVLEAQRIEAGKHIDSLAAAEKVALNNPEAFVKRLESGEKLDLPVPLNITTLPKINFANYNLSGNISDDDEASEKHSENNDITVRGRVFDQTKPETFNQLWTCEEQRRLEELLIEFPPEPIEMRRFAKIARALGNRTTKQVASRLQKYFQKLHAAGLPVPGRIPRGPRTYQTIRKSRMQKHMHRPTTFFPSNYVPVNMGDDDDVDVNFLDPNTYRKSRTDGGLESMVNGERDQSEIVETMVVDEQSDSEVNPGESDKTKIARLLKRVKRDKEKNYKVEESNCDHIGYECDYCKENPITGTRWHCTSCKDQRSVDYCSDCLVTQALSSSRHSLNHTFIGLRVSSEFRSQSDDDDENDGDTENHKEFNAFDDLNINNTYDKDYMPDKFAGTSNSYNYLDPNFLPE